MRRVRGCRWKNKRRQREYFARASQESTEFTEDAILQFGDEVAAASGDEIFDREELRDPGIIYDTINFQGETPETRQQEVLDEFAKYGIELSAEDVETAGKARTHWYEDDWHDELISMAQRQHSKMVKQLSVSQAAVITSAGKSAGFGDEGPGSYDEAANELIKLRGKFDAEARVKRKALHDFMAELEKEGLWR